jgi:hypothetical protein
MSELTSANDKVAEAMAVTAKTEKIFVVKWIIIF